MTVYNQVWDDSLEPNETNIRQWLDNLYSRFQPIEQARWNEANIDSLFHAGSQQYVNRYFNFAPTYNFQNYYFNLIQAPVSMVTGYQRQHRKSINYIPTEGADTQTTDQYTRLITHLCNSEGINETFSRACELAAISGMVLLQPYLDYMGEDPLQGALRLKIWEYNSYMTDPYFRDFPGMSDCQHVWCQEFISKREALNRFRDHEHIIKPMAGTPQRYGRFYFLPENYNMNRNDLLVISYVWFKSTRKKKKFYSESLKMFFDYSEKHTDVFRIMERSPDMKIVEVDTPTWKLATVLNDQLMSLTFNPLGFDQCPFIPVIWSYDPHLNYPNLRVRSLVFAMRSPQFLLNRKIIIANDIEESTINAGWKRKSGAVANEDTLKKTGQGYDIIVNEGYEMGDVEKILPSSAPASTMQLAEQLANLIFATSGVNLESWKGDDMKQMSSLTLLVKQAANLMVLQKYFDQWDQSLKMLGEVMLAILQLNWSAEKVELYLGEQPTEFFFNRLFAKCQVVVEEGLNTATQKHQEFMQWMELNQALGGVIPASEIAKRAVIQGKNDLIEILQKQEQMQAAQAQHTEMVAQSLEDAKIKELYSKAVANISMAKERQSRSDSNLGLYEERLSEISHNRAMTSKQKVEALEKLIDIIHRYGEIETMLQAGNLQSLDYSQIAQENREKQDAKNTSAKNEFVAQMLTGLLGGQQGQQMQQDQFGV